MRPGGSFALALLLCFTLIGTALAQKKLSEKERERAAALYKEANAHYQVQEYEEALKIFKDLYRLSEQPVLLYNLAQCQRQLGMYEEALKSYQAFLREADDSPLHKEARARVEDVEEILAKKAALASIELSSEQDPAEVFLNGEHRGQTPLSLSGVAPGEHLLVVKKEGFLDYELSFRLAPGQSFTVEIPQLNEPGESSKSGLFYLGGGISGGLGVGAAAASLGLSLLVKREQADTTSEDENGDGAVDSTDLDLEAERIVRQRDLAVILGHVSTGLVVAGLASGVLGFLLKRGDKKPPEKEGDVSLSLSTTGAALKVRF